MAQPAPAPSDAWLIDLVHRIAQRNAEDVEPPAPPPPPPPPSPLRRVDVPRLFLSKEALDAIAERTPTPRPPRCPEESESPSSE